jgi:hypothetical protein
VIQALGEHKATEEELEKIQEMIDSLEKQIRFVFMNQVNFLQSLGWSLINSLWQMALLWVAYQFITVFFHKIRPAHKTSLATIFTFSDLHGLFTLLLLH